MSRLVAHIADRAIRMRMLCELDQPGSHPANNIEIVDAFHQKANLTANCISRGGAAFTTWPKRSLSISPLTAAGPKNWV